ncbi:MAG: ribosomal protein S18-alanine N-acetyltransferase [Pseudomonadota bacterium]|nr:ribosomal-protein-alanine N-acetyltransferase [Pseudomonadales bacterium]MDY6922042.1 ribosomal protein S18-alanine N-acetyltransferase [Pseudomonadota bacterium]
MQPDEGSLGFDTMSFRHLPEVMAIEQRAYPWPWTEGMFVDSLRNGHWCYLARRGQQVLGYAILSLAVGDCHLLNLCIDPAQQGRGYGSRLLQYAIRQVTEQGACDLFLEVRVSNKAAMALYTSQGFQQVGRRRDYYPAGEAREDALVYHRVLTPPSCSRT